MADRRPGQHRLRGGTQLRLLHREFEPGVVSFKCGVGPVRYSVRICPELRVQPCESPLAPNGPPPPPPPAHTHLPLRPKFASNVFLSSPEDGGLVLAMIAPVIARVGDTVAEVWRASRDASADLA